MEGDRCSRRARCGVRVGQTGAALVDLVDYVMFTGSVNTGRHIAVAAAQRLIPCSLELGGKDAMIVCADADIERAANGAYGRIRLHRPSLHIGRAVYVEEPVYDEFVSKVVAKTSQLRQGMDAEHDYSCEVGSMTTAQQLAIVSSHVDDAVSKGARVLVGGKSSDPAGLFYEPTVLVDVDHGMKCMREETFGPTLPVMKVRDVAEAIEKANDSGLGLSGSVWTRDKNKGMALARKMNTGTVNINNVITSAFIPGADGGWNESGVGSRSGGAAGIRKYCRTKSIVAERVTMKKEPLWYPYSPKKGKLAGRHGPDDVGQGLGATHRAVTPRYNHHDAVASRCRRVR